MARPSLKADKAEFFKRYVRGLSFYRKKDKLAWKEISDRVYDSDGARMFRSFQKETEFMRTPNGRVWFCEECSCWHSKDDKKSGLPFVIGD